MSHESKPFNWKLFIQFFHQKHHLRGKNWYFKNQFGFLLIQTQFIDHYKNLYLNKCTRLFFSIVTFFQRIMTQAYFLQPEPSSSSIEGFEFRVPILNEVDQFSTCQSFFNANSLPSCKPLNVWFETVSIWLQIGFQIAKLLYLQNKTTLIIQNYNNGAILGMLLTLFNENLANPTAD